jgi:cyclopropane fatty-acyl-phospholipid synthase-like methyltransferase
LSNKDSGWWDDYFPAARPLFSMVSQKETNAQVRYLVKKLGLKPGMKFLDCPCGIGRTALAMAKMGIKITGVDITQSYLDEFARKSRRRGLKVKLVRSDMRRINFDSEFDASGNLWTSFGYFAKESDNFLTLKKMYRALKPGGKFMLHVINRDWIMTHFATRGWQEIAGIKSLEERHFDYRTSVNHGTLRYIRDGEEKIFHISVRMYSFHELVTMFESVGFVDIEGYGSIRDEPIDRNEQMMFIIGSRPKRR